MSDKDKSIMEIMTDMKKDIDSFYDKLPCRKPDVTIGQSGRRYYTDPADRDPYRQSHEDIACAAEARHDFEKEEALLQSFPDQGHKLSDGRFKNSDGSIAPADAPPLTEWDEKS